MKILADTAAFPVQPASQPARPLFIRREMAFLPPSLFPPFPPSLYFFFSFSSVFRSSLASFSVPSVRPSVRPSGLGALSLSVLRMEVESLEAAVIWDPDLKLFFSLGIRKKDLAVQ